VLNKNKKITGITVEFINHEQESSVNHLQQQCISQGMSLVNQTARQFGTQQQW